MRTDMRTDGEIDDGNGRGPPGGLQLAIYRPYRPNQPWGTEHRRGTVVYRFQGLNFRGRLYQVLHLILLGVS